MAGKSRRAEEINMEKYEISRGPFEESGIIEYIVLGRFKLDTGIVMVVFSSEVITVREFGKEYRILPEKEFIEIAQS